VRADFDNLATLAACERVIFKHKLLAKVVANDAKNTFPHFIRKL
jgi:hypothetical protein